MVNLSTLGDSFPANIADTVVTIFLPRYQVVNSNASRLEIVAPSAAVDLPQLPEGSVWGSIVSHTAVHSPPPIEGYADVRRILIVAQIPSNSAQDAAARIYNALGSWWQLVLSWIEAISGQCLDPILRPTPLHLGQLTPFWVVGDKGDPSFVRVPTRTIIRRDTNRAVGVLGKFELGKVLSLASRGCEVPPAWQLLSSARATLRISHWRRAVIDAGTAAEIAISELIDNRLSGVDDTVSEALLDGYKMLGNRARLFKRIGGSLPSEFERSLVQPRNRAVHGHVPITELEAYEAVKVAEKVVRQLGPQFELEVFEAPT